MPNWPIGGNTFKTLRLRKNTKSTEVLSACKIRIQNINVKSKDLLMIFGSVYVCRKQIRYTFYLHCFTQHDIIVYSRDVNNYHFMRSRQCLDCDIYFPFSMNNLLICGYKRSFRCGDEYFEKKICRNITHNTFSSVSAAENVN